jgi:hypothetical protein
MQLITPILEEYRAKKRLKQLGCYSGDRSKTIEIGFDVKTPIAGQNYYFKPDNSLNCDKVVITEIAIVSSTEQGKVQSANGTYSLDNLAFTLLNQGYLCICNKEQQVISTIPLINLVSVANGERPCFTWFDCQVWDSCYFIFETTTSITSSNGLVFRITYFDKVINVK